MVVIHTVIIIISGAIKLYDLPSVKVLINVADPRAIYAPLCTTSTVSLQKKLVFKYTYLSIVASTLTQV